MTNEEQIDKLTKENARLKSLASSMHSRVVALTTRVTDLELTCDNYASKQELLVEEIAEAKTKIGVLKDLHDERFDVWTDTNWGA